MQGAHPQGPRSWRLMASAIATLAALAVAANALLDEQMAPEGSTPGTSQAQVLEQLAALPQMAASPQLLLPQSVEPRYYPTIPNTPSALRRYDYPPIKVSLNGTDYAPGYKKVEPGDLNVYSRRTPSVWVTTGMAEAPGTTLTQQSFALKLIQPRVERDQRKLELEFKAAREGRGNLTLDGSPVLVADPAMAIHKVMQRKEQMKWTIKHWNDECFDYSPHYQGEKLQPCPVEEKREEEVETPLEPGPGVVQTREPETEGFGKVPAAEGSKEVKADMATGEKKAKRQKTAQIEAEEAARRVLKGFKDVQIDGESFVPVFIPSGHPEFATARLAHRVNHGMRAQHQIHRHVMTSQPDDGVLGASTDEARLGDAGHVGDETVRATLPAVHQHAHSFASKIAGVEHLVQAIMASLSLQPGVASDGGTDLHKADAAALGGATGGVRGAPRAARSSERGVLLRRLRDVVRQLSRLRRGHISAGQARSGWPRSSLQQPPPPKPAAAPNKRHGGTTGQPQQAARGEYAASHKASGAVVAPGSPVATATVADTVAEPHTGPGKVSGRSQPLHGKGGGGSNLRGKAAVAPVPPLRLVKHDIDAALRPSSSRQEQRRRRDRARRVAPTSKLPPEASQVLVWCSLAKHAYARTGACNLVYYFPVFGDVTVTVVKTGGTQDCRHSRHAHQLIPQLLWHTGDRDTSHVPKRLPYRLRVPAARQWVLAADEGHGPQLLSRTGAPSRVRHRSCAAGMLMLLLLACCCHAIHVWFAAAQPLARTDVWRGRR